MICPNVFILSSDSSGQGKTEFIYNKSQESESLELKKGVVTFHISGPVSKLTLVKKLCSLNIHAGHVLHIDVGMISNPHVLDIFLFELLVLGYVSAGTTSFFLPTSNVFIEVANTVNDHLKNSLTLSTFFQQERLCWGNFDDFLISHEINSPVQVVCQYLHHLEKRTVDSTDISFTDNKVVLPVEDSRCRFLLAKYFSMEGEMSFSIVHAILNVLADQLKKLSCSDFFRIENLTHMCSQGYRVKTELLKVFLNVYKEFAYTSVRSCKSKQKETFRNASSDEIKDIMQQSGSEGMIHWEDNNHLVIAFHNSDIHTLSALYRSKTNVPLHIQNLMEAQCKQELPEFDKLQQHDLQIILQSVARSDATPLSKKTLDELSRWYAITPDNLLKMVLIILRINANIPVIIMGETGCGKTSLLYYLSRICGVQLRTLTLNAGTDEHAIEQFIHQVNSRAMNDFHQPIWLFLDEINTCDHLGLISSILCHHRCLGKLLGDLMTTSCSCGRVTV